MYGERHIQKRVCMVENLINKVICERYYILEELGSGGYSRVYKARDMITGDIYVLKQYITSDPNNKKTLFEGMENELNILKNTHHPVLPKIFNLIKFNGKFFLVMEYIDGINLEEYIKKNGLIKKRMLVNIINQVCSGLYYLHSMEPSIVYRDLKPSNIMILEDENIKLIDFGIAKRYNRDISADEFAWGSRGFAAPEQIGDKKGRGLYNTDIRTDIYGVGTTIYYLKTGKKFSGTIKSWRLGYGLKKIVRKCTMINPDLRYQDCIELLCAIKNLHIMGK